MKTVNQEKKYFHHRLKAVFLTHLFRCRPYDYFRFYKNLIVEIPLGIFYEAKGSGYYNNNFLKTMV